ncbi:DUF3995 domain-containing protein [Aureivirga marina]|uniref:DUF3995 domain-containing protein n=1 Tax=Aureivirga marina TaxID=1182451 RepID=UPI0018C9F74D|nr:DUF3995 domain-containing protein [Aureivirga marina]
MKTFLSLLNTLIFLFLSFIHFYWALGFTLWINFALPTNKNGIRVLNPSNFETIIVGIGLLFFAFLYFLKAINKNFNNKIIRFFYWFIPIIFLIRSIGDFKYVGFFKTVKGTEFANADATIFSPLCLYLAISGFIILYLSEK